MAVDAVEATESLPKETGLVGLDGPLDELDLTKMLAESIKIDLFMSIKYDPILSDKIRLFDGEKIGQEFRLY
jgi:hypothetical protein